MKSSELHSKALAQSKKGDYARAIKHFDKLLELYPDNAEAYSDRGVARFHTKDLKGALSDMNMALDLEPKNPYRYASRAYIKESLGDTEGAIDDYKKALVLDPEDAVSHNNLGMLEEKLGYQNKAQKRFKLADKLAEKENDEGIGINALERDETIQNMLEELNIPVESEEEILGLRNQMLQIFKSKEDRKDFFRFLLSLFKRK